MLPSLPTTMRAAVLHSYNGVVTIEDREIIPPRAGDVIVKIAASPLNPSDVMFTYGMYGFRKPLPTVPGFEASGVIVAVGEGVDASRIGQRVACFAGNDDGAWAEYMRIPATNAYPVLDSISDEQASMLLVNPLTARALVEIAQNASGSSAIVQTAAASALGKMIIRLAAEQGIPTINIVRRAESVDELTALGAAHVLDSSSADFEHTLRELAAKLNARVAFDAVGGDLSGRILHLMPRNSRIIVYGGLSLQPVTISLDDLIFRGKHVEGFWLSTWLPTIAPPRLLSIWQEEQAHIGDTYKTDVRARYGLEDIGRALADYSGQMSGGKVLLTFMPED